jgi:glutathione peroxidase
MKLPYTLLMFFSSCFGVNSDIKARPEGTMTTENNSFYDFRVASLDGDTIDFSMFKGKKVLIVNTASECGYTKQYAELQKLHEEYGDKVVVLGFPANDFGQQEKGTNKEIKEFCKKNYGVTFQMFEKVIVKGEGKHQLFKWLSDKDLNGWNVQEPSWNFCKYLVNEKGELVKFYASGVEPLSKQIIEAINN